MTQTDIRSRILDVALACFLADGYEQTTIAQIRTRSGTSNGALFHHFPSKEAIAGALHVAAIASFQQGLWELVGRKPRSLRAAVRAVLEHRRGSRTRGTEPGPGRRVPAVDGAAGGQRRDPAAADAADHGDRQRPGARDRPALAGRPPGPAADLVP